MNAARALDRDKYGYLPGLLEPLRWAMNPVNLRQPLLDNWPELEAGLDTLELERIYPRGQRGFLLEYRIADRTVYAELRGEDAASYCGEVNHKLRKLTLQQSDDARPVRLLADPGMVLRRPGIDHRLPMLGLLNRPDQAEVPLAALLGRRPRVLSTQLLAHRLGRRAVLRVRYLATPRSRPEQLIVKCYKSRNQRHQQVFGWMQALARGSLGLDQPLRLAQARHCDSDHSCLLMEDVAGIPLDQLRGPRLVAGVRAAGAILQRLQHQQLELDQYYQVDDELGVLARWVPLTATLFPSLAPRLNQAWAKVERGLSRLRPTTPVICHRDYYDKQLIVGEQASVLLDLDTLCMADPALDIGNFLAHLQLLELQRRGSSATLWRAFHAGLGDQRRADPQAITLYRMAALLRIACIHAFWSRWQPLAAPLLDACDGA